MQKTEHKEFLGKTFTTVQLPAMRAMLLFRRISSFLAPPMAALAAASDGGEGKSVGDLLDQVSARANLGGAVKLLFDSLSESQLEQLTRDMLASTTVDNGDVMPQFDLLFQGNIDVVFAVLLWVFEVNYGSFYAKVGSLLRGLTTTTPTLRMAKASVSPAA